MKNIIWKQPNGRVAVTVINGDIDSSAHALELQERGDVPANWSVVATDYTLPANWLNREWLWNAGMVPDTADDKARMWDAIKNERDRRTDQGGYKVGTKWFHSDQKSRSQQLGLVLLGASIPANLQWKTMDGSFVTMTATLAQQVLAAAAASDQAIFAAAETHKAAMEASADPASYDFSGGWPATFAG